MGKQEQIDKIASWMGWHKSGCGTFWLNDEDDEMARTDAWVQVGWRFDPFTNPSDCAKVMEEVVKMGEWSILVVCSPITRNWLSRLSKSSQRPFLVHGQSTWMEAFCLALLEAIGKE